jgi:uncharacterized glyoxalase superfamily protein PhnB
MSQMSDFPAQSIFPAVRYRDPDAAITWLGEAFDCVERVVYRDDSGAVRHAELEVEGNVVMIGIAERDGWLGGEEPRPLSSTVSLYVVVEDPDARDLEGNLWSFGTYRPEG